MKTYVIGDVHGANRALLQVLERSNFDYEKDTLISLGDIADGWSETYDCVETLLKIRNRRCIRGNHDDWTLTWMTSGIMRDIHYSQGGRQTFESYKKAAGDLIGGEDRGEDTLIHIPKTHLDFFKTQLLYYVDNNKLFVHGGFNRHELIGEQHHREIFFWDRDLWYAAMSYENMGEEHKEKYKFKNKNEFDEIYIGHTTTETWRRTEPMKAANIYNMDTGCGWSGKLSMMNVETKELYQSDTVTLLYPEERGRR